jgi:hypothetical protein
VAVSGNECLYYLFVGHTSCRDSVTYRVSLA